jgi:type VI secretion system secreted protein VgrG
VAQYTQANRPLRITTSLGPDALLLEKVTGTEALSTPFQFRLDLLAESPVAFDKLLGQSATLHMTLPTGSTRLINGIFARFTQGNRVPAAQPKTSFIRYRGELVPMLWLLGRRVHSRVFQQKTVLDILKQVLTGDWQLTVHVNTTGTYYPRNYCVQYQESDLAFVHRLMEQEGIFYYFTHTDGGHAMVLSDSSPTAGTALTPASVYYGLPEETRDTPRIWDLEKTQELRPCKHVLWDYCFQLPTNDLSANCTIAETVKVGSASHRLNLQRTINGNEMLEVQDAAGAFAHWSDGINASGGEQAPELSQLFENNVHLARVRAEEEAAEALTIRGAGDCASFAPGYFFTLTGHFDADDAYLLTRVEHVASLEGVYTTNPQAPPLYHNEFRMVPKVLRYRPPRVTSRPRVEGALKGVVIGPVVNQAHCDKYGRIKVQFPWGPAGTNSMGDSCWLRVSQAWAGQTWGMLTLPRVGQEVAVSFYHGDPDQPYVSGSHYNADQMPPYNLPAQWRQSGNVSSSGDSVTQYHEIRLDDTPGNELLVIHSEKDLNTTAENDHAHSVANAHSIVVGINMNVKAGPKSTGTVNANPPGSGSGGGSETVDSGGIDWTVDNQSTYNYGNQALSVRGSASAVTFGAQNAFVAGAMSTAVVGMNTTLTLGGNLAIALIGNIAFATPFGLSVTKGWCLTSNTAGQYEFHDGFHIRACDGQEAVTVNGNSVYTVQGIRTLSTTGDFNNTVQGAMITTVTLDATETVSGAMTTTVTGTRTDTTTAAHVISSPASLTLQCGGSSIVLTPASITMTCGGSVLALTDAEATLTSPTICLLGGGGSTSLELGADAAVLMGGEAIIGGGEITIGA